jgi:hypothetical protein
MKTNTINQEQRKGNVYLFYGLGLLLLTIFLFFSTTIVLAQKKWDSSEVKTKSAIYKREISESDLDRMFITNKKFELNKKGRLQYDNDKNDFSFVSLLSHDSLLSSFRETFTKGRIKELTKGNDRIDLMLYINEKGSILTIRFLLNRNTLITPDELDKLENIILKKVKYRIVGKRVDEPIFYVSLIPIPFSEVESGEIKIALASERYKGY